MKKSILQLAILLILATQLFAQSVAINANGAAANTSSILDVTSTTKGLLIPRMTTVQRTAIAAPAKGLLVFDISTNSLWFHNGTSWNAFSSGSSTNYWTLNGSDIYNNSGGNVGVGTAVPLAKLHIAGNIKVDSTNSIEFGAGIAGKEFNAGKIGYETFTPGTLDIVGAGTNGTNRKIKFWSEAGAYFNGSVGIGVPAPLAKLHIAGNVKIDGNNTIEFGAGVAGKEVSAGEIGYQSFGNFDALDIVGAGTTGANRKIKFWNEGGAEFSGNIGVGNAATVYKMDIADRIRIRSSSAVSTAGIALNNSNNSAVTAFIGTKDLDLVGIYGNVSGWGLLMNTNTGTVGIGYQNPVAGYRLSVLGNQYINGLISTTGDAEIGGAADVTGNLFVGGKIGVGGTANIPLEVYSDVDYTRLGSWTYYDNGGFSMGYLSIRAHGDIMASVFVSTSDARIKDIIAVSSSAKDLQTVNKLQITDYTMKDKLQYGDKPFKKVIAQEVEKVYPQIISKHTDFIPNVYLLSNKIEKTSTGYLLSFTNKHNISNTAKKLRVLLSETEGMQEVKIVSIPSETQVIINLPNIKLDKVFVYGEEVDDFRTVDYEGLTTLNISATQELSKLIKKQQAVIETQQQQIAELLKRMQSVEKNIPAINTDYSLIKK
jgi:uncharacterized coiled-coil protein SlyX